MSIQENIKALQNKYDAVKEHCMCRAIYDDGAYYRVLYPAGDWPDGVEGVQAGYLITGKLTALTRMLDRMERDWSGSFPGRN